ncbi:MAG TPA: hypothetical protein VHT34_08925, partial [Clostridia bacterium]|nr:hypothetical protein [Clostridia bacterium]
IGRDVWQRYMPGLDRGLRAAIAAELGWYRVEYNILAPYWERGFFIFSKSSDLKIHENSQALLSFFFTQKAQYKKA